MNSDFIQSDFFQIRVLYREADWMNELSEWQEWQGMNVVEWQWMKNIVAYPLQTIDFFLRDIFLYCFQDEAEVTVKINCGIGMKIS